MAVRIFEASWEDIGDQMGSDMFKLIDLTEEEVEVWKEIYLEDSTVCVWSIDELTDEDLNRYGTGFDYDIVTHDSLMKIVKQKMHEAIKKIAVYNELLAQEESQ